jgi:hypothetical protein
MLMKKNGYFLSQIFTALAMILLTARCSVVKKPYFQTEYFRNTISGYDSLKINVKASEDSIFAGFSKINITPVIKTGKKVNKSEKIPIAGFGQVKTKYATGVHDSLYVRAIALKSGSNCITIVSADMLLMPPDIADTVFSRLSRTGLDRDHLFLTATHTHSGIGGWGKGLLAKLISGKKNPYIKEFLAARITDAVTHANKDLLPASVATGSFCAPGFVRNRLTGDPSQLNSEFSYIFLTRSDSSKALIGSYSAHATNIGSKNTLLSADYPGYWSSRIEKDSRMMAMFCGGSMAGQSPVGRGSGYESAEFIGEGLADSVLSGINGIKLTGNALFSSISMKMELPEYRFRLTKNLTLPGWMSRGLMPEPENVRIQAFRINDLIWYFTPGDFSGEYAQMLNNMLARKGIRTVVSGYNGGYIGYIIPGKYFWLDHYESRSMSWFGPTLGDYMFDLMNRIGNSLSDITPAR